MTYNYIKKIGGTDREIHISCPKCKATEVIIIVIEGGYYGVGECKKCGYKNKEVYNHLNGKFH